MLSNYYQKADGRIRRNEVWIPKLIPPEKSELIGSDWHRDLINHPNLIDLAAIRRYFLSFVWNLGRIS